MLPFGSHRAVCWLGLVLVVFAVTAMASPARADVDQSSADAVLEAWIDALADDDTETQEALTKPSDDDEGDDDEERPDYPRYRMKDFKTLGKLAYDHPGGTWAVRAFRFTMISIAYEGADPVEWKQTTAIVLEKIDGKWFVNPYVQLGQEECPDAVQRALRKAQQARD